MFSQLTLTLQISIATLGLGLTLLFISIDACTVHELNAAAAPSGEASMDSGFSLPLIHWRSLMLGAVKEEIQVQLASSSPDGDQAIAGGGEKLLVPLYGSPQSIIYLVQHTGSDLSWTQCDPCMNCSVSPYLPLDTSKSRTFRRLSCDDPMCESGDGSAACSVTGGCLFRRRYGDGGTASGDLVSDVFHFSLTGDDTYQLEKDLVFGCANVEDSKAVRGYSTGVLALGNGKPSFVTQLGVDKFSYCIPASEVTDEYETAASYLRFGTHARMPGKRAPVVQDGNRYSVLLKSVMYRHGDRLNQQQPVLIFAGEEAGGYMPMLVDSGSTLLWLPGSVFYPLQRKIEEDIGLTRGYYLTLPSLYCYIGNMSDVEAVSVTLSFDGGVDLELFGPALFFTDEVDGAVWVCLAAAAGNKAILGVYPQRNTNVGYDLSNMEIAFDRDDCDRV